MKLHYRIVGEEGFPLVILHGLFGFSDNWQTHAKKLSSYFKVILVDLRNHGHSPWSDDFSYQLMVEDVSELLSSLKIQKCILLGHSMGGKVAMHFAQKYPEKLEKLIVVDIGIKSYPMHHQHILEGIHAIDTDQLSNRKEAEEILEQHIESDGVRQFLLKNLYWKEKGQLAWRMNIKVLEDQMPEILSAIPEKIVKTPTVFIRGELSNYILDDDFQEIQDVFPDSDILTIENAGHWVHAEAPDRFINEILNFTLR